jgi:hypothetical protein
LKKSGGAPPAQKTFITLGHGCVVANAHAQDSKKFFGSFFQKRTAST